MNDARERLDSPVGKDAAWLRDKADLLEAGDPRSAPWAERMRSIADRLSVMEKALREIRAESLLRPIDWPQPLARIHSIAHVALAKPAIYTAMSAASVDDEMVERIGLAVAAEIDAIDEDLAECVNVLDRDSWRKEAAERIARAALAAVKLEGVGEPSHD